MEWHHARPDHHPRRSESLMELATQLDFDRTIDIAPTWTAIMPELIANLKDGNDERRAEASVQLLALAAQIATRNKETK